MLELPLPADGVEFDGVDVDGVEADGVVVEGFDVLLPAVLLSVLDVVLPVLPDEFVFEELLC